MFLEKRAIIYGGSEEQKQKYIPRVASGEIISASGLNEPSAGSDAMALKPRLSVIGMTMSLTVVYVL